MKIRLLLLAAAGLVIALASGCASLPADRGSAASVQLLKTRSAVAADVQLGAHAADVAEWLKQPLDADAAVRVALVRSPQLQALYAQLGLAQADVYDASRLSNPTLGFMRATSAEGVRTTWNLTQRFTELLFFKYRKDLAGGARLQAEQRVAQAVLELEAQVRTAYYQYITAELVAQLHEQGALAAQASADYAQSLFKAGNVSELQVSRERVAASQAKVIWQSSLNRATRLQADLLTAMGLAMQKQDIEWLQRLNVPVEQQLNATALQTWAEQQRVDLAMLREQANLLSKASTHTRRWFWLDDSSVQFERERETDGTTLKGVGGSVGLPLFNQGGGARLRAQGQLETAQAELLQHQLALTNDLRAQLASLQRAREIVEEYRQTLVPLQERVVELSQQQQNYMLIGAFELLNAKRELLQTYQDYLTATGEYWVQYVALEKIVGGKLPEEAGDASYGISVGVDALPAADAADTSMDDAEHAQHNMNMSDQSKEAP
ncbi:MAG: TolC family protein [Steroidobacteraceae bacterium]